MSRSNIQALTMLFQYMSDLHLERAKYNLAIPPAAPILLLGGDIGRFCDEDAYSRFLQEQCAKFDKVLLVAGNHEFYGSSRDEGLAVAERLCNDHGMKGKLTFLNRTLVDFPEQNVVIMGCTLHSYIAPHYTRLTNDFEQIKDWRVAEHNAEHALDLQWLQTSLEHLADTEPHREVIVMTHYAPAYEKTSHPRNERNELSQCFSSETLTALRGWKGREMVRYWIFGHTHWNARFRCGKTVVVSNQLCGDDQGLGWLQKKLRYKKFDRKGTVEV